MGQTLVVSEEKFSKQTFSGKRYLGIAFVNTVLHKSAILLISEAEFTESKLRAETSRFRILYFGALEGNAEQLRST